MYVAQLTPDEQQAVRQAERVTYALYELFQHLAVAINGLKRPKC